MSADKVEEGDKVSWNWNGSHPSGTAAEVKAGDVSVVSHRGNEITKTGTEDNPAVHIERSGNDVVKTVSELKVEQKAAQQKPDGTWDNSNGSSKEESKAEDKKEEEENDAVNGEEAAKVGEKRKADETEKPAVEEKEEEEAKKQKTTNGSAANGTKKGPGRPKGAGAAKKEKKEPRVGTAARKTRSQGKVE